MVGQLREGAWGSDVRAGIIGEIGCQAPWTALERRVMRGALIAQRETGAAHNGDPARTIISHIDRTIFDADRLLRLADSGIVVEFDLFGQEHTYYGLSDIDMPNDGIRLKWLRTLIDHGHLERIVISHDICYRTRLTKFGGHGYGHIFENVVPMMRRRGFSADEIDTILVKTPRRLLTFV